MQAKLMHTVSTELRVSLSDPLCDSALHTVIIRDETSSLKITFQTREQTGLSATCLMTSSTAGENLYSAMGIDNLINEHKVKEKLLLVNEKLLQKKITLNNFYIFIFLFS